MTAALKLSQDQKDFLQKCEEDFKDRFTEKDEHFMKVFNATPAVPPIVDPWYAQNQNNRRNNGTFERRHNRRRHPYNHYNDRRENQGDRGERHGDRGERQGDRGERQGDRGERQGDRGGDNNDRQHHSYDRRDRRPY